MSMMLPTMQMQGMTMMLLWMLTMEVAMIDCKIQRLEWLG